MIFGYLNCNSFIKSNLFRTPTVTLLKYSKLVIRFLLSFVAITIGIFAIELVYTNLSLFIGLVLYLNWTFLLFVKIFKFLVLNLSSILKALFVFSDRSFQKSISIPTNSFVILKE